MDAASHCSGVDVSLLRLRLRFGSPRTVVVGVAFRVAVDLVDEMAQPPALAVSAVDCIALSVDFHEDTPSLVLQQRASSPSPLHWRFDCVVRAGDSEAPPPSLRLRVSCCSSASGDFVDGLRSFCVGSQWLVVDGSHAALILPVVSDEIRLAPAPESPHAAAPSSSRCLRTFALPGSPPREIAVEEDYGHAMGSHVWDASIWISFAVASSGLSLLQSPQSVLEIGSGCGLFASVLARMATHHARIVVTEKPDALPLLEANLRRNGVARIDVHELLWGEPSSLARGSFDVVFAADVLYHWASHEALLATLLELCAVSARVMIAHKHRSATTSQRLESVLASGVDAQCQTSAGDCAWSQWHVQRLVRLASTMDLLLLTRRR